MRVIREDDVRDFHCEASLKAYAGGGKYQRYPEIPGLKSFSCENGRFTYVDSYSSNGLQSGGMSVISLKESGLLIPVWMTQYHGEEMTDDKRVIQFLRKVLKYGYETQNSFYGRGPLNFPADATFDEEYGMNYAVRIYGKSSFQAFNAEEGIFDSSRKKVFVHYLVGRAWIPLERGE